MVAKYLQEFEELLKKYRHTPPVLAANKLTTQPEIDNKPEFLRPERSQQSKESSARTPIGLWILIGTIVVVAWLSIKSVVETTLLSSVNAASRTTFKTQPDPNRLVQEVQQQLNRLGYDTGKPTGILDEKTMFAIKAFQSNHKIISDGYVSNSLLATLINTPRIEYYRPNIPKSSEIIPLTNAPKKSRGFSKQETREIVPKPECNFKTVMSDDDYRACGINPPE